MRIAIDAAELGGRPTGVGRYLGNLLDRWLASDSAHEFTLLCSEPVASRFTTDPRVEIADRTSGLGGPEIVGQQLGLARALARCDADVFFAPAYTMPLLHRGPTVLTMHDISFEVHPEWFTIRHGARMRWLAKRSAYRADRVITVSHTIEQELQSVWGLAADRITTIEHGIDASMLDRSHTPADDLRRRFGLERPFALMVGTLFERRYPSAVVRAFTLLNDLDLDLVVVGDDRRLATDDLEQEIDSLDLGDRVRWLRYCSDDDLLGLYRRASQLIYLSEYEGFGLPPLEAMLFGIPVIVSARGALEEIYGDAAILVHDENPTTVAAAIRRVAEEPELAARHVDLGARLVGTLSLDRCAARTLEVIEAVGGRHD